MHLGAFRIEEPDGDDTVDINDIDLVIVPAVAYDRRGNRVGRGKGYYDRLLSRSKATTIGICYDFQLFDEFDTDEFDIPVDYVVGRQKRHYQAALTPRAWMCSLRSSDAGVCKATRAKAPSPSSCWHVCYGLVV